MRQVEIGLKIARPPLELLVRLDAFFGLLALLENFLRLFLVLPEIRLGGFCFEAAEPLPAARSLKGSSARVRCAFAAQRSDVRGLRESWIRSFQ